MPSAASNNAVSANSATTSMAIDQQFVVGRLLDRAHDRVAVLRLEDQRPENRQIEGSLQEVERLVGLTGRHLTEAWIHLG